MKFWDASAIVPLMVSERRSDALLDILEADREMIVWWGSPIECVSAISRLERDGMLGVADAGTSIERLRFLSAAWHEVQPLDVVRSTAQRLLRVHPLRSADSQQLAAAIQAAEREPSTLDFVSLDARLTEAASREGFRIVGV